MNNKQYLSIKNLFKYNITNIQTLNYYAAGSFIGLLAMALFFAPTEAHAAKFDLNAFGSAALDPITQFVIKYWPAGLFISGTGGALLASGDLRTRAVGFGTGVAAGGLLIGGAATALGIV